MIRACKVSLKLATKSKLFVTKKLLESFRSAVNFYLDSLYKEPGRLDMNTFKRLPREGTRLPYNMQMDALNQALATLKATKASAKALKTPYSKPFYKGGATLTKNACTIEDGKGSFDFIVKVSQFIKGKRLVIPTKKTKILNKWLEVPGAKLKKSITLTDKCIILFIEIPDKPNKTEGKELGLDIGVNKLISLSTGEHLGKDFKALQEKYKRKKHGSKAQKRCRKEINNFVDREVNKIPFKELKLIVVEDLKNLKKGKEGRNKKKSFRKAMIPWTYPRVLTRIEQKAQENRVHLVSVNPAYTSQTCPCCFYVSRKNRKAESFCCTKCGYSNDADTVGAMNILVKALGFTGSVEPPELENVELGKPNETGS